MSRRLLGLIVVTLVNLALPACVTEEEHRDSPQPDADAIDWSSPQPLPRYQHSPSEFVSGEKGYRFHPRSAGVKPRVAYRFDTGHCGLSFLTDFDGSFWRPIRPEEAGAADLLVNQDVGAIALADSDTAIYRSSDGIEVTLKRVRGSVVRQLCA